MNTEQRHAIQSAIELIAEAQMLVDEALDGTDQEAHYRAYGRYGFNQLLNNGNPYDPGLSNLLEGETE